MEVINSGAIGGAFGLLEMSARMSVPKFSHYSVGDKNYGDNFGKAWGQAAETHGTLTRNWLVNDSWSLNLSLFPAVSEIQQQQKFIKLNKAQVGEMRNQLKAALDPNQSPNGKLCDDFLREAIKQLPGRIKAGKDIMAVFEKYAASRRGFFYAPGTVGGENISSALSKSPEIRFDFKNIKARLYNSAGFPNSPEELVFELIHELLHGAGKGDQENNGRYDHEQIGEALIKAGAKYGLSSQLGSKYARAEDITRKACGGSKGWNTDNTSLNDLIKYE